MSTTRTPSNSWFVRSARRGVFIRLVRDHCGQAALPSLTHLVLADNPLSAFSHYRRMVCRTRHAMPSSLVSALWHSPPGRCVRGYRSLPCSTALSALCQSASGCVSVSPACPVCDFDWLIVLQPTAEEESLVDEGTRARLAALAENGGILDEEDSAGGG